MEKVNEDISRDILIRLPAKAIAQLRCVCKRWNTFLCEPNFIKSHLHLHNNKDDEEEEEEEEVVLVFKNRSFPVKAHRCVSPDIELTNFIKLPVSFPSEEAEIQSSVIGCANGLICFSVGYFDESVIHVWNPCLSALLTVPPYATPVPSDWNVEYIFRFGFDPEHDDYKIVKLIRRRVVVRPDLDLVEWLQGEVYSMRSGCWKLITQKFPSRASYFGENNQVRIDGHDGRLHWLCHNDELEIHTIVAFHLATESFTEIPLPDPIAAADYDDIHTWFDLGVFSGKLCVISCTRGVGDCEVWVMDQQQHGSWVKTGFSHFHEGGITPYGFTFKNNFLYEDSNKVLHLYNSAANKVKPFRKMPFFYFTDIIVIPYVESLVWVTPPTR